MERNNYIPINQWCCVIIMVIVFDGDFILHACAENECYLTCCRGGGPQYMLRYFYCGLFFSSLMLAPVWHGYYRPKAFLCLSGANMRPEVIICKTLYRPRAGFLLHLHLRGFFILGIKSNEYKTPACKSAGGPHCALYLFCALNHALRGQERPEPH